MILNERKLKILEAIINDYITTAEPIGSRTIAKKYDIGLSSATIRNEMSDLEEMGFIIQPHASSGRVPSDKGYRLYVDTLMGKKELLGEEASLLYNLILSNIEHIDFMMQEAAKAISMLTSYTTIVSEPMVKEVVVRHIQLLPYDENSVVMVLVTENKVIKNYILKMESAPNYETLSNMSSILNHILSGRVINNTLSAKIKNILRKLDKEGELLLSIIDNIINTILADTNVDIFTTGVKNILAYPEFSDLDKAKGVFQTLEEKDVLITLLDEDVSKDIKIIIGNENKIEQIKDCSLIKTSFKLGGDLYGTIGILGPTRMNYSQVVSVLHAVENNINLALKALYGG